MLFRSLDLSGTPITALPDGLTVGGNLYLRDTPITALPDGLTVGGSLDLGGTPITALPDGLTVGGNLYLRDTPITALPDGLTVGGSLDLGGTPITERNYRQLHDGDYVAGRYLYADGILTHIRSRRSVGQYTFYKGKIAGKNVISDGNHYAHCKTLRDGISDLNFKAAKDRGLEQYRGHNLSTVLDTTEAAAMYRIITGACAAGTQAFIDSLPEVKDEYSVGEMISLTSGQYGADSFREFFKQE